MVDHQIDPNIKARQVSDVYSMFNSAFFTMTYRISVNKAPWGITQFTKAELGDITVFLNEGHGVVESVRNRQHVVENPASDFVLFLPVNARSTLLQNGRQSLCTPGEFRIVASSSPFYTSVSGTDRRDKYSMYQIKIPGPLLRDELPVIDDFCNHSFSIRAGAGEIMRSFIELAFHQRNHLCPEEAGHLGDAAIKMIRAAILGEIRKTDRLVFACESNHNHILEKAKKFIFSNLSDPALGGCLVAEHCGVSERYLRTIFNSAGLQIWAYIRGIRLDKIRTLLRDPAFKHRSVQQIAVNWGYANYASFCRSYKTAFGKSPQEDRFSPA